MLRTIKTHFLSGEANNDRALTLIGCQYTVHYGNKNIEFTTEFTTERRKPRNNTNFEISKENVLNPPTLVFIRDWNRKYSIVYSISLFALLLVPVKYSRYYRQCHTINLVV
ncbi:hypothetical protein RIR_jg1495.t1 [Rhizophagus irregularis DAOM 181602=DAOM 197198]|nr:hypothetical protein RIR_jg1495.t1 [Rhizophagus irregularis DAOM 181602=DAOM 197198]